MLACALDNVTNAEWVTLWYLSQGDKLSDEQVAQIFNGDIEAVEEHIDEWVNDYDHNMVKEYVKDFVPDEDDRELLETHKLLDELEDAIREKNDADPLGELMRATGDVWLRWDLGIEIGAWESSAECDWEILHLCEQLNIDFATNEKAVREVVEVCQGQGDACIIWRSSIKDACQMFAWSCPPPYPKLRWNDPTLWIEGYTAKLTGRVSVETTAQHILAMPDLETDFAHLTTDVEADLYYAPPTIVGAFDEYREDLIEFFTYRSKILEGAT